MESKTIIPAKREYVPHAHKLETPMPLAISLREAADKISFSDEKNLVTSLVDFKQNVVNFMTHFNIDYREIESDQEDKRNLKGGFSKRAVQDHPFLGERGLRLVRDKLSNGMFLKIEETDLYITLLNKKIAEETKELIETMNKKERKEELGDVFEVFNTLLSVRGINESLVEHKRQTKDTLQKREKKRKLAAAKT